MPSWPKIFSNRQIDFEITTGDIPWSDVQQKDNEVNREDDEDNMSTASYSTVKSNSSLRLAKVKRVPEVMNFKLTKDIIANMEFQEKGRQDMSREQMKEDIRKVTNIFKGIEMGFDTAFAAGAL